MYINLKKNRKKRRWKHPLIIKLRLWFLELIAKYKKPQVHSEVISKEEKETFIQGIIRINHQTKQKSEPQSNIREFVPYKMYKARELLLELEKQKEGLAKSDYRRNKNIN